MSMCIFEEKKIKLEAGSYSMRNITFETVKFKTNCNNTTGCVSHLVVSSIIFPKKIRNTSFFEFEKVCVDIENQKSMIFHAACFHRINVKNCKINCKFGIPCNNLFTVNIYNKQNVKLIEEIEYFFECEIIEAV